MSKFKVRAASANREFSSPMTCVPALCTEPQHASAARFNIGQKIGQTGVTSHER
jgi:hypothetical protein